MKRKTWIIGTLGVLTLAGLGATAVVARGGEWCEHPPIVRKTTAKLDGLEAALKLTPQQQGAWDTFEAALTAKAGDVEKAVADWRSTPMPATALGRLDKLQHGLDQGQALVSTVTEATKALYPALDADQQAVFDREFRFRPTHRRGWHGAEG
ncbi:Spy/CpxP family protein refolding chaperone [Denitromonas iodatirespirans]|uniref:Spy/CpxP family protein refolding chaperone n=1 Tax=Denitromonas iodatirespirans TaxID=2795389 RepID=A0A944H7I1_DENI1|nr:Spy/CpxP family protein refolding chaperone [Denitromonas iodatirespirans]MBT0961209.1 Spy/CpxP family protein refolding chaperone [Denitromonas iodatirespirans]